VAGEVSNRLHWVSSGWVALAGFLVFLLFAALVLPHQAAQAAAETGAAGSPDTSLFYRPNKLYDLAEAYGPQGRQAYIRARFTFDLIWPLVYAFFLTTSISWLSRWAFPAGSAWLRANLVPLLAMAFDYLENISTSVVMARYPDPTPVAAWLAPVLTLTKWLFVGASFLLLVTCVIAILAKAITAPSSGDSEE
jgi:hypothetical protein